MPKPGAKLEVRVDFFEDVLGSRAPIDNEHNTTGLEKEVLVAESGAKDLPDPFLLQRRIEVDGYDHPGQIVYLGNCQEDLPPSTSLNCG